MFPGMDTGNTRTFSSCSYPPCLRSSSTRSEALNNLAPGSVINLLVRQRCVDSFPGSQEHQWGTIFFDCYGAKFVHESPIRLFKDCMVTRAMAQYFLSVRATKLSWGFDLNSDKMMLS